MAWWIPALPLLLGPLLMLVAKRWQRTSLGLLSVGVCIVTLLLAAFATTGQWQAELRWSEAVLLQLSITPLSSLFALTIPVIATPIVAFAAQHERTDGLSRLLGLLLFFMGAMELLVLAADLLTLLMAWEIVGACSWALINHDWHKTAHTRQANWAFLVTRTGDLGLFIAVFAAFVGTGSFAYDDLGALAGTELTVFTAGIVLAAAAKSAQVPFSPWLFAAMAGPVTASALLHAATMVAAGVFLLIRLHDTLIHVSWFAPWIMGIGLITALAAGCVASTQFHAKKLLAASTSAHFGLMWIAVGAGYPGIAAVHFVTHAAMKATLFLITGIAGTAAGHYDLRDMKLKNRFPIVAIASFVAVLALAGMFPLGASWSKEKLITAAGHTATWLAIAGMIAGALCAVYAARFQQHMFGNVERSHPTEKSFISPWETFAIYGLSGITLLLSLLWWPGASQALEHLLTISVPAFKTWELLLSLTLVAAGLGLGYGLAKHADGIDSPAGTWIAGWLSLPKLALTGIAKPIQQLSLALSRFDRQLESLRPNTITNLSHTLARFDRHLEHIGPNTVTQLSRTLARADDAVVDRVLLLASVLVQWLARIQSNMGEWLFERIPQGFARLSALSGTWTQQLQTGMSHHYYTLTLLGVASFIILLIMGGTL